MLQRLELPENWTPRGRPKRFMDGGHDVSWRESNPVIVQIETAVALNPERYISVVQRRLDKWIKLCV